LARVDFVYTETVADLAPVIGAFASAGVRVQPIFDFHGGMPTAAQAQALASWAAAFGPGGSFWANRGDGYLAVRNIEFGNETSYSYQYGDSWDAASYVQRAQAYALRFRDAQAAIKGAGGNSQVGLLAQADDGDSGSSNWVNNMFAAVPELASLVSGWVIHPYGPGWQARIDRMNGQLAAVGAPSSIPIFVTEYGIASDDGSNLTDNYGWPTNLTYAQTAGALQGVIDGMLARYPNLVQIMLYENCDIQASGATNDREAYFGALRYDGSNKGQLTSTIHTELAAHSR
jgi:hypothetical protein